MAGTGHSVTLEEKRLIVKVHEYMKKEQLSLRKAVKEGNLIFLFAIFEGTHLV